MIAPGKRVLLMHENCSCNLGCLIEPRYFIALAIHWWLQTEPLITANRKGNVTRRPGVQILLIVV